MARSQSIGPAAPSATGVPPLLHLIEKRRLEEERFSGILSTHAHTGGSAMRSPIAHVVLPQRTLMVRACLDETMSAYLQDFPKFERGTAYFMQTCNAIYVMESEVLLKPHNHDATRDARARLWDHTQYAA